MKRTTTSEGASVQLEAEIIIIIFCCCCYHMRRDAGRGRGMQKRE